MLERLDAERRRTSSAALQAQEQERARVARDLHDEVNQALTGGLLLRLEAVRTKAPPEISAELSETKALANQAMDELLHAGPGSPPHGARRPRARRSPWRPGQRDRAARPGARGLRVRGRLRRPAVRHPARGLPGRPGGDVERHSPRRGRARCGWSPSATGQTGGDLVELSVGDDGRGFYVRPGVDRTRARGNAGARAARGWRRARGVAARPRNAGQA